MIFILPPAFITPELTTFPAKLTFFLAVMSLTPIYGTLTNAPEESLLPKITFPAEFIFPIMI